MTFQEVLWQGKIVWVTGILSKSGKIHRKYIDWVGRGGVVIGEAKNGMLLIRFTRSKGCEKFAIPAGCVSEYTAIKHARTPTGKVR